MKLKVLSLLAALVLTVANGFSQDWVWKRGSPTLTVAGTYGTMNVASSSNDPGGRHGFGRWTDTLGNIWMFGGEGYPATLSLGWLSDLWKYTPSTNQWTWVRGSNTTNATGVYGMKGTTASTNDPGAREFPICWTDHNGMFWMYGGDGYASTSTFGRLADLWQYNPYTNQWTWIGGSNLVDQNGAYGTLGVPTSTNMPGSRYWGNGWVDNSNNLWMFGGRGFGATGPSGFLNDLWKYNISTNQWTWVNGPNQTGQFAVYGTLGVAASSNLPGCREFSANWYDATGNKLYMFGGRGNATTSFAGYLSDMWSYDISSGNWTWVAGSNTLAAIGHYGTQGTSSSWVRPGGRFAMAYATDLLGNFWIFGGDGFSSYQNNAANLNDLFKYSPSTNQWTWMKGDTVGDINGKYGTQGVAASTNKPGGRHYTGFWVTNRSKLWLFGSFGLDSLHILPDQLNDLWTMELPCNPLTLTVTPASTVCTGQTATLNIQPVNASPITWYSTSSPTLALGTGSTFVTPPLTATGVPMSYSFFATSSSCSLATRPVSNVQAYPQATPSIVGPTVACSKDQVIFYANGISTFTWNTGAMGPVLTTTATAPGQTVTVTGTDSAFCAGTASFAIIVNSLPVVSAAVSPTSLCAGSTATFSASGANQYNWTNAQVVPTFTMSVPVTTTLIVTGTDNNGCAGSDTAVVNAIALPNVIASASSTNACDGNVVTFSVTGADSYLWSNNKTSHTFTAAILNSTTLTVVGTSSTTGCSATSTVIVKMNPCLGLEDQTPDQLLKAYPNPSDGTFTLLNDQTAALPATITDALGKTIRQLVVNPGAQELKLEASGIYFLHSNGRAMKLIVQ